MNAKAKKLKLYVWEGVLTDYTDGIAFALAHDVREAKRLLIEQGVDGQFPEPYWDGYRLNGVKATVVTKPSAFSCRGGS